jgi:Methyltransferase domain
MRPITLRDPVDKQPLKIDPGRRLTIDPYVNDVGHWGASLVNNAELLIACLDAAAPRSVLEVGAYAGDLTRLLLEWAAESAAQVSAIDPAPKKKLEQLAADHAQLELVRATSLEALPDLPLPDAAVIDGDHNYYTVSEELRLIAEKADAAGEPLPLLMFHDVCWPHARRDSYYTPERIPEADRQPMVEGAGLFPGEPGVRPGGLPYFWAAEKEGGPRNGVLTAIETFVGAREGLVLAIVPAFFGFGALWHQDAPYAEAIGELLAPFDRNPLMERLEANRSLHLASSHYHLTEANALRARVAKQEALLQRLLESSAFSFAEHLSKLRLRVGIGPSQAALSKENVRRVIDDRR